MKNICFTDNDLHSLLNFRGDIIKELLKDGHRVSLIVPENTNINVNEFDKRLKYYPIKLLRKNTNPFVELKYMFELYRIYRKEKFDIIFHYTIKPNIYGNIASKLAKCKSISIVPGLGYTFIKKTVLTKLVTGLYKLSMKFSREVWFLNEDDKKEFIQRNIIDGSKARILPSEGINLEKFKPIEKIRTDNRIIFLMIARVLWDKGYKEYVEAAEIIKKKYNNVEFQLLGQIDEGNPSGVPKEIIYEVHDKGIINYLGTNNDVSNVIKEIDCLVLPSYREGIPRTLMEGAAMEKPLITTNSVGCKEIVKNGYNGYLCKIKNSQDLSKKIEKFILLSPEEIKKMGINGRKYIKDKYDIEYIKKIYIKTVEY